MSRGKPKRDAADEAQAVGSETESEESDHDLGVVDDDDEEDDVSGVRIIDDVDDDTTAIDDEETPIRSRTKKRRQ